MFDNIFHKEFKYKINNDKIEQVGTPKFYNEDHDSGFYQFLLDKQNTFNVTNILFQLVKTVLGENINNLDNEICVTFFDLGLYDPTVKSRGEIQVFIHMKDNTIVTKIFPKVLELNNTSLIQNSRFHKDNTVSNPFPSGEEIENKYEIGMFFEYGINESDFIKKPVIMKKEHTTNDIINSFSSEMIIELRNTLSYWLERLRQLAIVNMSKKDQELFNIDKKTKIESHLSKFSLIVTSDRYVFIANQKNPQKYYYCFLGKSKNEYNYDLITLKKIIFNKLKTKK